MKKLLVIADDLTGAADTAARCHHAGLSAMVRLRSAPEAPDRPPFTTDVLALQSDSRHLLPHLAAEQVRDLCQPYTDLDGVNWYKKIDSTLRGNIGSELDALLDLMEERDSQQGDVSALICPAFPAYRRGLEEGYLVHDGRRSTMSHLPTILADQSRRSVTLISPEQQSEGGSALAETIAAARDEGHSLLVVDAMTDEDLRLVVQAGLRVSPNMLLCGSAGLASAWTHAAADKNRRRQNHSPIKPGTGPILCIVGSGSPMAQSQIDHLLTSELAVANLEISDSQGAVSDLLESCKSAPADVVLLHLPPPQPGVQLDGPEARRLASRLAEYACQLFQCLHPALLITVGGDTAIHTLQGIGVGELLIQDELLPGMPFATAVTGNKTIGVILKSGNHGEFDTLPRLIHQVRPSAS